MLPLTRIDRLEREAGVGRQTVRGRSLLSICELVTVLTGGSDFDIVDASGSGAVELVEGIILDAAKGLFVPVEPK